MICMYVTLGENRMSSSSSSGYCEDNPGVCIGVPIVVVVTVLVVLVIVIVLLNANCRARLGECNHVTYVCLLCFSAGSAVVLQI